MRPTRRCKASLSAEPETTRFRYFRYRIGSPAISSSCPHDVATLRLHRSLLPSLPHFAHTRTRTHTHTHTLPSPSSLVTLSFTLTLQWTPLQSPIASQDGSQPARSKATHSRASCILHSSPLDAHHHTMPQSCQITLRLSFATSASVPVPERLAIRTLRPRFVFTSRSPRVSLSFTQPPSTLCP